MSMWSANQQIERGKLDSQWEGIRGFVPLMSGEWPCAVFPCIMQLSPVIGLLWVLPHIILASRTLH